MEEKINADVQTKLENIDRPCDELSFDMGDISDMYENGTLNESEKSLFINTLKQIVEKYDMRSVACVCLFRDIMTADLYDYLLEVLKKSVYVNEALSIRITQLLTCDDFPKYYDFLESVKDWTNDKGMHVLPADACFIGGVSMDKNGKLSPSVGFNAAAYFASGTLYIDITPVLDKGKTLWANVKGYFNGLKEGWKDLTNLYYLIRRHYEND